MRCIRRSVLICLSRFFLSCYDDHRDLHSFPTRRSSDLAALCDRRPTDDGRAHPRNPLAQTGRHLAHLRADRKSTRLNSSHVEISYAVFCLKKKKKQSHDNIDKYVKDWFRYYTHFVHVRE